MMCSWDRHRRRASRMRAGTPDAEGRRAPAQVTSKSRRNDWDLPRRNARVGSPGDPGSSAALGESADHRQAGRLRSREPKRARFRASFGRGWATHGRSGRSSWGGRRARAERARRRAGAEEGSGSETLSETAVIVLAAGQGTRMKSRRAKVLHELCGVPMLGHVLRTARALSPSRLIVVVGRDAEAVRARYAEEAECVLQAEQRGTGHAVQVAEAALDSSSADV